MPPEFVVVVRGDPAPQGSKELQRGKGGKVFMVEASKRVDPWRKAIVAACLTDEGQPRMTFTGPVAVGVAFMFRQAKSNDDDYPVGQNIGDLDKLLRAVYDALTQAKVIEDDRFVVDALPSSKRWSPSHSGARITVRQVAAPNPFEMPVNRPAESQPHWDAYAASLNSSHDEVPWVNDGNDVVDFGRAPGVMLPPDTYFNRF